MSETLLASSTKSAANARVIIKQCIEQYMHDLVPIVQFEKPEKHPLMSDTFSKVRKSLNPS